jgi:DNA-binding response OmpR family regulator
MIHKILIVEDTPDVLGNLNDFFELEGFEVIESHNGLEALDKIYLYNPDVIITDLRMPVLDGFELLKRIKSHPEQQSIPVVIFTANATPENELICSTLGASAFVRKPSSPEVLLEYVNALLKR